ncbi:MAG: phytanoyl-CoA dioxygenase family protein [Acidimicrobiales bacterium]|nr:phytanoyl-CoA dioxygenase family protein [Acidimicrobiales bacterium]
MTAGGAQERDAPVVLTDEHLRTFGTEGHLVVRSVVPERVLAELDAEVDALVAAQPPPAGKVGFHHYFEHPSRVPVSAAALDDGGVRALAEQLVAPHTIDLAFDHVQIATSIHGWDHVPGGGHIDGYGLPGQTEPATFTMLAGIYLGDESEPGRGNLYVWPGSHLVHEQLFRERGADALMDDASMGGHACLLPDAPSFGRGRPVLARRGDVLLAHYLLAHNQSGNTWNPLRRIVYFRLAADGHRDRWRQTQTDALFEYAPVRAALGS